MDSLEAEYDEVEKDFDWPEKPHNLLDGKQLYRLAKDLIARVRQRSLEERVDAHSYERRLWKIQKFLDELWDALNQYEIDTPGEKQNHQRVWYHRPDFEGPDMGGKSDDPQISRSDLLQAAATYLSTPWLQHDQIDWILIDALVYVEISSYRESILSGRALGKIDWAYVFAGSDAQKRYWFQIKQAVCTFALRYVLPPCVIGVLYYRQADTPCAVVGWIYAAYLVLRFVLWPLRYRQNKAEQAALREHAERLQRMVDAYYYCKPPVVSLCTLRSYLEKAAQGGAIIEGAVFSVLKGVEARKVEAFMPFTEAG